MRGNPVKARLAAGGKAFGTMVFELTGPGLPAILADAGADYVLYDMEHSGLSMDEMKAQFAYCRGLDIVPLVRPPGKQYNLLSLLLDLGAMGFMLPMVESAAEAAEIVSWTRYPPDGVRGAMFGAAHDDYAAGDVPAKMRAANARTFVMPLIETASGIENVEEILAVPGIDAAHLGHFDLSLSMGMPGEFERPEFQAAVDRLLAACETHGKPAGCMVTDVGTGRAWMERGFRLVSYSADIWLVQEGLRAGLQGLKGAGA